MEHIYTVIIDTFENGKYHLYIATNKGKSDALGISIKYIPDYILNDMTAVHVIDERNIKND